MILPWDLRTSFSAIAWHWRVQRPLCPRPEIRRQLLWGLRDVRLHTHQTHTGRIFARFGILTVGLQKLSSSFMIVFRYFWASLLRFTLRSVCYLQHFINCALPQWGFEGVAITCWQRCDNDKDEYEAFSTWLAWIEWNTGDEAAIMYTTILALKLHSCIVLESHVAKLKCLQHGTTHLVKQNF